MRMNRQKIPALVGCLIALYLWPLAAPPHARAEGAQVSEESISFDPKKTDDLLEKIEAINKSFTYRRGGRRDPFAPLLKARDILVQELREREGSWELFCDPLFDSRMPLSKFELDTLELKGLVWGGLGVKALLKAPDGKAYNVRKGDYIGTNCGKVIKITHKYMKIEEKYKNQAGRIRIDYKYKVLKRKEAKGTAEGGESSIAELEPGSPTESITVDIDAEESTLVTTKGEIEKLMEGDAAVMRKVRKVTLGPGEFEAVIVGGAFNIDLPKTTRYKSQVSIFIPPVNEQPSQTLTLGLDTEFTSLGLAEIASLGQRVKFRLVDKIPVLFFFSDQDSNNSGVISISVSRLVTLEEVQAARRSARRNAAREREERGRAAEQSPGRRNP